MGLFDFFKKTSKPKMGEPEANDQVRDALESMGDDGSSVRHVIHYAYPGKTADMAQRPEMEAELKARGFEVTTAVNDNGFVMEHYRTVTPDDFDAFTQELSDWFSARGWDYDGWECAVSGTEPTIH